MTDIMDRLTPEAAQQTIRDIAKFGFVTPSSHCFYDSMGNRNYSTQDLEFILKNGKVKKEPKWNHKHSDWKYEVEGKSIDGDKALVITVILSHRELFAVTIMPK
jgi:hypothetical protein